MPSEAATSSSCSNYLLSTSHTSTHACLLTDTKLFRRYPKEQDPSSTFLPTAKKALPGAVLALSLEQDRLHPPKSRNRSFRWRAKFCPLWWLTDRQSYSVAAIQNVVQTAGHVGKLAPSFFSNAINKKNMVLALRPDALRFGTYQDEI